VKKHEKIDHPTAEQVEANKAGAGGSRSSEPDCRDLAGAGLRRETEARCACRRRRSAAEIAENCCVTCGTASPRAVAIVDRRAAFGGHFDGFGMRVK
jgi:hypothetical protein